MWGTFLSEPLLIDGQVGRYPACCLIRRIPIRHRRKTLPAQRMRARRNIGY